MAAEEGWKDALTRKALQFIERRQRNRAAIEKSPFTSLEEAVQQFEKSLLQRLYAAYPSTRQLAARLRTSHTAIGQRLRKYGIRGEH